MQIRRLLLPVDYPCASPRILHQAAVLIGQFDSEVILLHVVTPASHAAGLPTDEAERAAWTMLPKVEPGDPDSAAATALRELGGVGLRRILVRGEPARAIVETAQQERADLIMMPSHGYTFSQFLLGSVTSKVLNGTECPVWTDAHLEAPPPEPFAIRRVVCAVDFQAYHRKTIEWAVSLAAEYGAHLTLAHATFGVEQWGPGGEHVDPHYREMLVGPATEKLAQLRSEVAPDAETFIGSGEEPQVLREAVLHAQADLLVVGCRPYGGHLRTHGYSILCAVPVPVVSM